jgi:hypothetical protein
MANSLAHFEPSVWRALLKPWLAALALSALLVGAGARWPIPLLQQAWAQADPGRAALLALALVLVPPGLMAALLVARMVRHRDSGESSHCAHGER